MTDEYILDDVVETFSDEDTLMSDIRNNPVKWLLSLAVVGPGILSAKLKLECFSTWQKQFVKNNSGKQIHKNIAKFMAAEIQKCSIGSEVVLNKLVSNQITAQPDICPKINNWTDPNSAFIASAFENHFKAANWKNPHSIQFYGVSTCSVDVTRKNVSGNLGLTCIDRDFWGKKFEIGTNVSEKGEKMFTLVSVD